ncbi:MAG: LPS assembly lipoprotein LptE [Planctomycetota bacterium]
MDVFENRTGYPGLEAQLAKALVRELQADGTLVPRGRFADSVLSGTLVGVRRSVLQEDEFDDVVTGQVTVAAVVTFEDSSGGAALLEAERVTSADARGSQGVFRLATGETEEGAIDSALRELARNIVRRAVEAW